MDENGLLVSTSGDGGNLVAECFLVKKPSDKRRYFGIYRVIFAILAISLQHRVFIPTIEDTSCHRDNMDG